MILSRAHTSAKAGDAAKLLLLNIEHTQRYEYDSAPPLQIQCRVVLFGPPNRNHNLTLTIA